MSRELIVAGGGLAGCEAAWQAAGAGIDVVLYEQRPQKTTPAHSTPNLAELVCSNSLRSDNPQSGPGLLKQELRLLGSLIIQAADECRIPAGQALAVDRTRFSKAVEKAICAHPRIRLKRQPLDKIPEGVAIIATGPLTSDDLAENIARLTDSSGLHFYDATSPIVDAESIDRTKAFEASRYGKGEASDYLNCPLNEQEYESFIEAVGRADSVTPREFEDTRYFEGCLPIEVMIERGPGTLAHGPMKPVGLADPSTGLRPFAVVQLRKENLEGTCYNLVGFQTRLKWPDQDRVFRLIPALADAEFLRYGSIHRNTFLRSPGLLDLLGSTIERPGLFFAGQITGVEGYIESTASGLLSGLYAAAMLRGIDIDPAPRASAHGSLMHYISASDPDRFQPSNIHMGLLPAPAEGTPKKQRKRVQSERALAEFARWRDVWVKALRGI